jgi:hypothetical protein
MSSCTCNCFDAAWVRTRWYATSSLWTLYCEERLELQGPQKTIVFHMFSTGLLFYANFVPFLLQSLYNQYEHLLCMISSRSLFAI